MITITRRLEFDYGHRVLGHENKCKHLHGHRGVAEITVRVKKDGLDHLGRVIDFSVIKRLVGGWIDDNWDHNFLVHPDDPLLQAGTWLDVDTVGQEIFGGKDLFIMPTGQNPTAENMAKYLYHKAQQLLCEHGLTVDKVRLYETPGCWADYSNGDRDHVV